MNVLTLAWKDRPSLETIRSMQNPSMNLPWQPVTFLDFLIDGGSLKDMIDEYSYYDRISIYGQEGWNTEELHRLRDVILGDAPTKLDTGRVEIYICAECGDIGCGSITASLRFDGERVTWEKFGDERNYEIDEGVGPIYWERLEHVGPFTFDRQQYREAILNPPPRPASS